MVFAITSGKGGVGKSTVSVGLADAMCKTGKKVILVDADEGLRCLDRLLDSGSDVMLDLGDAQQSERIAESAVVSVVSVPGLYLLAAPCEYGTIDAEKYGALIASMQDAYDAVIIDCPAGVDPKYYSSLPKNTKFVVVTNSDAAAVEGAMKVGIMLRKLGFSELRLILNRFDIHQVGRLHENADRIIDKCGIGLMGIVPFDGEIIKASAKQEPAKYGRAAMAFARIAARCFGRRVPLPRAGRI